MQTYIGTKIIRAKPMNRQAYNDCRGWVVPMDENPLDEGYLVEYLDGGTPNTVSYAGYVSWSPKAQFDAAYTEVPNADTLYAYQVRISAEKAALDKKRSKLITFIKSAAFEALDTQERGRLTRQLTIMDDYSAVLGERLCAF